MTNETKPFARSMMFGAWILLIGLLILLFNNLLEKQYNPNQQHAANLSSEGAREVTLKRNRFGHYVTSGTINGYTVVFLLDTGASDVSVPAKLAEEIGLERGSQITYQTANGPAPGWLTRLDSLGLGAIQLENLRASINPNVDGEEVLLGMTALKQLEFTQRGDSLTIRQY